MLRTDCKVARAKAVRWVTRAITVAGHQKMVSKSAHHAFPAVGIVYRHWGKRPVWFTFQPVFFFFPLVVQILHRREREKSMTSFSFFFGHYSSNMNLACLRQLIVFMPALWVTSSLWPVEWMPVSRFIRHVRVTQLSLLFGGVHVDLQWIHTSQQWP